MGPTGGKLGTPGSDKRSSSDVVKTVDVSWNSRKTTEWVSRPRNVILWRKHWLRQELHALDTSHGRRVFGEVVIVDRNDKLIWIRSFQWSWKMKFTPSGIFTQVKGPWSDPNQEFAMISIFKTFSNTKLLFVCEKPIIFSCIRNWICRFIYLSLACF